MDRKALLLEEYHLERELDRRRAQRGDLLAFTRFTFPEYQTNWHHRLVAEKLNLFVQKKIRRLMVFMPPRTGKSELGSRRLAPLIHGLYPDDEILAGSYNGGLASDFTIDVQRIIDSDEYRAIFPKSQISKSGKDYARKSDEYELVPYLEEDGRKVFPKGSYNSAGLDGSFTGKGANWFILDDLIKNHEDADSQLKRDKAYNFYTSAALSRMEKDGSILLLMTRWNTDDVPGRLLKKMKEEPGGDQWEVVSIPAIRETGLNPDDPRQVGESIWPEKYSAEHYAKVRIDSGSRDWASLYQQRPFIESGNLVKRDWWQYFEGKDGSEIKLNDTDRSPILKVVQFWDCAQKVGLSNDFSVCSTWAKTKNGYAILDVWRGRLEAPDLERLIVSKFNEFRPSAVVIEDKSSGSSLIQNLRRSTPLPIIAWDPGQKDKGVRLAAAAPTIEAKKVSLPRYAKWVEPFITEHEQFPGEFDDQCDTTSMAVDYFSKTDAARPTMRSL